MNAFAPRTYMDSLKQKQNYAQNTTEFTVVENKCKSKIDLSELYGRCVTEKDGFTHYHFNTPTFSFGKSKQATITVGDSINRITIVKPAKKKVIKLTNKEFDELLREYGFQNHSVNIREPERRIRVLRPTRVFVRATEDFADSIIRDLNVLRGIQFLLATSDSNTKKTYLEVLAKARNKLMHYLNGNIDSNEI